MPYSHETICGLIHHAAQPYCLSGIDYSVFREECSTGKRKKAADLQIESFLSALYV